MLNYILPPIVIVISFSVLIVFLFRKAQKISFKEIENKNERENQEGKKGKFFSFFGQIGLKILEKIMQRLKLIALQFHNISNDWFHSIREKRQQRALMEQDIAKKQEQETEKITTEKVVATQEQNVYVDAAKKDEIRPLIREIATQPSGIKEKNQLEEALIKRIAINPKDIEAYERLGDYYLEKSNYHDSHECFSQVLRLSPVHRKAKLRIRRLETLIK